MHWRFFSEERVKVCTAALQEPSCVGKFSVPLLMLVPQPVHSPGSPQQCWTGRAGRLQSPSQTFPSLGEMLIYWEISRKLCLPISWSVVTRQMGYQLQSTSYRSEEPTGHDYFYLFWVDFKYGAILILKSHWYQLCPVELEFYLRALFSSVKCESLKTIH